MTAVGSGINQNIGATLRQTAIQSGFQGFIGFIAGFKRQIIAEDDKFLGAFGQQRQQSRQADQIAFVHFNQSQAALGIFVQQRFN